MEVAAKRKEPDYAESRAATKKPIRYGWVFEVGAKGFEPLTPWV